MSRRGARAVPAGDLLPFEASAEPPTPAPPPARDGEVRRVFLGWDAPALPAAARWLRAERGADLDGLLIALPGGRAVRRLTELLARDAPPRARPPRCVTQGALVDLLLAPAHPAAGRLARTLAWRRALEALAPDELERLARGAATRRDPELRLRLAETIRALHGVLAPDGLDFERLASAGGGPDHEAERARWRVLAKVQAAWRAALERAELSDPHEGRRAALAAGRIEGAREVVLVGVADMNQLLADLVARLGARATALIVAPPEHAAGFDAVGRLATPYWGAQHVPLPPERWFVEEKPSDQADRALDLAAAWCDRHPAESLTLGVADEEVAPYLERRLRAAGARLRSAAGTPLPRTRPYKLLRAVADYAERRGFAELAALARHPDAAPCLSDTLDPALVLDRYHEEHLPHAAGDAWPGTEEKTRGMRELARGLDGLLGELGRTKRAPLAAWAQAARKLLERAYGRAALDTAREDDRVVAGALRALGEALEDLESVPADLAGADAPAHEALRLLLRTLRAESVPPAPARPGEPTVEALGWLELPLDDAPALVVTGFNEGRVPQSIQGDAFLPDALRARLGLPDDAARLARDVYAARVLLASRADCAFVTGRRARSGDPLVPSRIAFQAPVEEVVERVRRFLPPEAAPERSADAQAGPTPALARAGHPRPLESMSVSSFKRFLESPYLFYLERVLGLRSRDDRARELDPRQFGSLAHEVLQAFGTSEARDERSADAIEDFLVEQAERLALSRFGAEPLPAVALQLEQLKYRFRRAAAVQAQWRAEGWRILRAEWLPEGGHPFAVDGAPMLITGRIDRVDAHEDGLRYAVLDYKTGNDAKTPEVASRDKRGAWTDLQLPLYRLLVEPLAREHGLAGAPAQGYFHVGKDESNIGLFMAEKWTDQDHEDALRCAADVVRQVRRGEFWRRGREPFEDDWIFRALVGRDLIALPPKEEKEEEEEE